MENQCKSRLNNNETKLEFYKHAVIVTMHCVIKKKNTKC